MVPNLIGRTLEEARADLEAVGLTLNQAQESNTDQQPAGKVFYQSIPVGTEVAQGTQIDIFISLGPSGGSESGGSGSGGVTKTFSVSPAHQYGGFPPGRGGRSARLYRL